MFLIRLHLSGSGLDIFVVSGGIRGINMSYLWKEKMIDAPIKKSVFLPNSLQITCVTTCVLALGLFFCFLLNFNLLCRKEVNAISVGPSCVLCTFLGSL